MKRKADIEKSSLVFCGSGFFGVQPGQGASPPPTDGSVPLDDGYIHTFRLAEGIGGCSLEPQAAVVKQGGTFPLWIAAAKSGRYVYATRTDNTNSPGYVCAYSVDDDGSLKFLGKESSKGIVPCHAAVVGKTLLVANFVGGNVAALPIKEDGSLGEAACVHGPFPGFASPHPSGRQATSHPHQMVPDPQGKFILVPDLGTNSITIYDLDQEKSSLSKHSEFVMHPGCGPRHLAFSPTAPFIYVLGEIDNAITPLRYDAQMGELTALDIAGGGTVSALQPGTTSRNGGGAAEIVVSPDGRHAYASVRCTGAFNAAEPAVFNTIAVFSLNATSGTCTWIHAVHSGGNMPWVMTLNATGDLLLVANQHTQHTGLSEKDGGSNEGHNGTGPGLIVVFERDLDSGMLKHSGLTAEVPQAMCITIVPKAT